MWGGVPGGYRNTINDNVVLIEMIETLDGLKDADEIKSSNDPLDADTDGDGIKDGAEHAGTVTAFDGDSVTLRQFNGGTIKAALDSGCDSSDDPTADNSSVDEDSGDDGDWSDDSDDPDADAATTDDGDVVDLTGGDGEDDSTCVSEDLEVGAVLSDAEFEKDGGVTYLVAFDLA